MSTDARQRFQDVFAIIKVELVDHFKAQEMPKEAIEWYTAVSIGL